MSDQAVTALQQSSQNITITVEKAAHGGIFVGRDQGRVVFVRGAAPGETVLARLLPDSSQQARFWRAEAIEIIEQGPDRVPSIWPEAGINGVGGADFAHIQIEAQRRIKTEVLQELLLRAKVMSFPVEEVQVEPAGNDQDGLGWRTRLRFAVENGKVGMRGWRSHQVYPVGDNPLAHPQIRKLGLEKWQAPQEVEAIDVVAPSASQPAIIIHAKQKLTPKQLALPESIGAASVILVVQKESFVLAGSPKIREEVDGFEFEVHAGGFWQVHRYAPQLLTNAVMDFLAPKAGEEIWDLYAGAGLFSAPIAKSVGEMGLVKSVESSKNASSDAEKNLASFKQAQALCQDVGTFLQAGKSPADKVVLDPPRSGVGEDNMRLLNDLVKKRIVYVSCEPSTLVRDLKVAEANGWNITDFRAFDLFPHTHHMECVVQLSRA